MDQAISATSEHRSALTTVFALTVSYVIIEIVAGVMTNSLALLADAGHMFTDSASLALALFAAWMSQKPPTAEKTYGYYRLEILAALVNAVVLCLVSIYIFYHAYLRLQDPPQVIGLPMLGVAIIGLIVNVIGVWKLHRGADESLNVRGAYLEVLSDTLGSLGVIIAASVMMATDWYYIDPLISVLIALLILPKTWKLLTQSANVLLEATPEHVDMKHVEQALVSLDHVESIHDLHVWTITSGLEALSAHLVVSGDIGPDGGQDLLESATQLLRRKFNIKHATLQIEYRSLQAQEQQV